MDQTFTPQPLELVKSDNPPAPSKTPIFPPTWAKALIVAELEENTSDAQSDYFGSKTVRTVAIAWSKHERDLFPELRKAAATFPETAHLGPGLDKYRAVIVFANEIPNSNGRAYWKGSVSHWHGDVYGTPDGQAPTFTTREAAEAYIQERGAPHAIGFEGTEGLFEWRIDRSSVEHREKYSMGHGYYLAGEGRYSGWQVRKVGLPTPGSGMEQAFPAAAAAAASAAPAVDGVTVTENSERGGLELRFPSKPSDEVRDRLKAHGWRWSRFSSCWYHRNTADTKAFAAALVQEGGE